MYEKIYIKEMGKEGIEYKMRERERKKKNRKMERKK